MNVNLYETELALALGDPNNQTYSATLIQVAMVFSVRTYARWRPLLRPFGSGHIYSNAVAGQNAVQVVGGPFAVGQTVQMVDLFSSETFTISSIVPGQVLADWMGVPVQLNLSGNLANNHNAGTYISAVPNGLSVVSGQQLYALPSDFVQFDNLTWDLANGSRAAVQNYESFYDGVYMYSQMLSGIGWGQAQTFLSSTNTPFYSPGGFVAVPNAPGTVPPSAGGINQTVFEAMPGNPPVLYINPPPQFNQTWQFNYYATHQPETVPDADFDALIESGRAICTEAQNQILAGMLDTKDIQQSMMPSNNSAELLKVAQEAFKRFEDRLRRKPLVYSG